MNLTELRSLIREEIHRIINEAKSAEVNLHYYDPDTNSDKVWQGNVSGNVLTRKWGRRGKTLRPTIDKFGSPEEALAALNKVVQSKLEKGYVKTKKLAEDDRQRPFGIQSSFADKLGPAYKSSWGHDATCPQCGHKFPRSQPYFKTAKDAIKACPKCKGKLKEDAHGNRWTCMECRYASGNPFKQCPQCGSKEVENLG